MTFTPVLWLLAAVPALVALYFLKLRRENVVVSSTLLWRRSVEDLHVNAPFQRLRRNLLLLLQFLVLAGLIVAAWRPRIAGEGAGGRRLVVLIDNSASMAAREDGGTRLELAKAEARDLIRGLSEGDGVVLLSFAARAETVEPLNGDKATLLERLDAIPQTALPTDLAGALTVAASVAEALPGAEIQVFGDGAYGSLADLAPAVKEKNIRLFKKGTALENAGITELDVRSSFEEEEKTEVFALVENFGAREWTGACSLHIDGALKDARQLQVDAGKSAAVVFELEREAQGLARVTIDAGDALALDDEAWARLAPPRTASVAVVGGANPWLDLVLAADTRVRHRRLPAEEAARIGEARTAEEFREKFRAELVVFDREAPRAPPPVPALYIGCRPPAGEEAPAPLRESLAAAKNEELPSIVDWDRTHPVNRFLSYTDILIRESLVVPARAPYRSLIDCESGSLAGAFLLPAVGARPLPVVFVGFDILKTNWPLGHYSFPIFFANAVAWLAPEARGAGQARWRTGESLLHNPSRDPAAAAMTATFRTPGGREVEAQREETGALLLAAASEAGVYTIVSGGEERERFPVALLDARESRITPAEELDFGHYSVKLAETLEEKPRELWKWFALAALAVLILEWIVYNRRLVP